MPFNGETVRTRSLGGSESAAYYLARELARRGHRVKCFTSQRDPAESACDGVTYIWHGDTSQQSPLGERFEHYALNTPHDLLIIQRLPFAFHKQYAAKVCIWQLHDLALHRSAQQALGGTWQIDAVTTVSDWHRQQVLKVWGLNPDYVNVVPNGVDPALYGPQTHDALRITLTDNSANVGRTDEDAVCMPSGKFLLLYQSRPERGLENALALMERAKITGLPIHLIVCGYDNTTATMAPYYAMLRRKMTGMDNVSYIGSLSKPQLAALQQRCDLLLYPTTFEEVSCITAMEAMHAGLPMLTSECAALPETCKDSGTTLIPLTADGQADLDAFDQWLQTTFGLVLPGQYPDELTAMRARQREAAQSRTWERAVDTLLNVYRAALARRRNVNAIVRHAIEHSDIGFAEWVVRHNDSAVSDTLKRELATMYAFKSSQDAYAAHYAKHQTAYYDEFEERVIGEDVTGTARFRGTMHHFATHVEKSKATSLRVLDYGCAHGHYTIPFAKAFSVCEFVGVDISDRAVNAARKWAERDKVENVTFVRGDQSVLAGGELGKFDVIVAGEVVEHVWDYNKLLNDLKELLRPGGCLIVTTPCGRWEHSGTVAFRTGREHLHHFERADIEDICRGHEVSVLHAPAGHDRSGFSLGSWVWAVWPTQSIPFWTVDYERKLAEYAPRQTVAACLIVRDGEKTLRRCVESFVDWVDEIIISIDPATSDRTLEICAHLVADFPHRSIVYGIGEKSAQRDGFEEARNETIDKATADWIIWIDSDEELRDAPLLHKLARPSMHNAYGFAQIHYAVDPPSVLTTDYPCRLFRNHIGVRFYGVVHEHPEQTLGKAIPYSIVRPELKFLHHGYFDEATRRARYQRNLPLLMRDVAKYPNERPLNKFLWLRDIAQSIQFDAERNGHRPEHLEQAYQGIKLMEQIADMPQIKMISDAMPYYSLCVATTGGGFDAEVTLHTVHAAAPDLAATSNLKGRFHSRDFYLKVLNKLSQETTKHYEDRHL
jgi:glycosyltransferase involved in cell wall biosynthesis/2-polyprenyl-3-methyl-5-hydroxy-6-metoxy-1,4-benzoquinol methylase